MKKISVILASLLISYQCIYAFEGADFYTQKKWGVGATVGGFFPYDIVGVRDKYRACSLMFVQPGRIFSAYDYSFYFVNDNEVSFYTASIGGRINFVLYEALRGYFKLSLNYNYYKRKPSQLRDYDFVSSVGTGFGFGTIHQLGMGNSFVSEFKFNYGPGNNLYAGIGFRHDFDGESSGSGENKNN